MSEQRWIFPEEDLPNEPVLCTYDLGDGDYIVDIGEYDPEREEWEGVWEYESVVAWMPLPEPCVPEEYLEDDYEEIFREKMIVISEEFLKPDLTKIAELTPDLPFEMGREKKGALISFLLEYQPFGAEDKKMVRSLNPKETEVAVKIFSLIGEVEDPNQFRLIDIAVREGDTSIIELNNMDETAEQDEDFMKDFFDIKEPDGLVARTNLDRFVKEKKS